MPSLAATASWSGAGAHVDVFVEDQLAAAGDEELGAGVADVEHRAGRRRPRAGRGAADAAVDGAGGDVDAGDLRGPRRRGPRCNR